MQAALRPPRRRLLYATAAIVLSGFVVPASANAFGPRPVAPPATAPAPAPAPAPPTCGGTTIYKADGTPWVCTFDDEFSGTTLDTTKWVPQVTATSGYSTGPYGAEVCYVNSPNNVSVAGGYLSLTVRREAAPFKCGALTTQYTGGSVSTYGTFSQAYGRFEVRAALPAATIAGLQESFWLWPVNATKFGAWPASGEIDYAEMYSVDPTLAIPTIHYNPAGLDLNTTNYNCTITNITAFHTYAVVWTPTSITVSYDGNTCLVDNYKAAYPLTGSEPFDQPFMMVLTQALGIGVDTFNYLTPLPATTTVDYVRAWK